MRAWRKATVVALAVAGFATTASAQTWIDRSQLSYGGFRSDRMYDAYPYSGYGHGYGYDGFQYFGPGYGFSHYHGPAYWGPPFNPPIYAFPPVVVGPTFGYGTAWPPAIIDPLNNSLLQRRYNDEWARLSADLADLSNRNVGDPQPGGGAVPIPSTPEAKIKSLRYKGQGDEAFARQDYHRAFERYKLAATTAKDNAAAMFRAGYALVAITRYSLALDYFKRGLAIDPMMAITGPTPSELYGDNNLAWSSHLGKVTEWVREDFRDHQRVFLLGLLLYFDSDPRAREFLEKAWQLSGGTETAVITLLNPPQIEEVKPAEVGEAPPVEGEPPAASDEAPATDEPIEGPELGAGNQTDEPRTAPATRPSGQPPLFPLPLEQDKSAPEPAAPPLPAPADG